MKFIVYVYLNSISRSLRTFTYILLDSYIVLAINNTSTKDSNATNKCEKCFLQHRSENSVRSHTTETAAQQHSTERAAEQTAQTHTPQQQQIHTKRHRDRREDTERDTEQRHTLWSVKLPR